MNENNISVKTNHNHSGIINLEYNSDSKISIYKNEHNNKKEDINSELKRSNSNNDLLEIMNFPNQKNNFSFEKEKKKVNNFPNKDIIFTDNKNDNTDDDKNLKSNISLDNSIKEKDNFKYLINKREMKLQINQEFDFEYERLKYTIPKRLDNLPYSRLHTMIIISLGISWILDGYEVSLLSVLSGVLETAFNVKSKEIGIAGSFYLLGCVIGSLFFGFLASIYGRKTLFNITLIIYGISIILTAFAIDINMFIGCRFFTGIAVGGEYSSIFAAIDEFIPPSIRGRADLIIDGTWHFGSFLASIISFCLLNIYDNKANNHNGEIKIIPYKNNIILSIIKNSTFLNVNNYNLESNDIDQERFLMRILFSLGAIAILPVIYMRKFIPESPRWLIYQGKYKEALKILESIEAKCNRENLNFRKTSEIDNNLTSKAGRIIDKYGDNVNVNNNNEENSRLLAIENSALLSNTQLKSHHIIKNTADIKRHTFKEIFVYLFKIHKTRFFYSLILMSSQAFFYNGIFYTYTLILQNFYNIEKKTVGLFLIPLSIASFTGPLLLGKYFDNWSRRKMIALTFILSGVFLIVSAFNFLFQIFGLYVQQTFWFVTFFVASPAASSAHLTVSEIFPIEMRSQAMAIFFSMGLGIGGVVSPFLYGWLVSDQNRKEIFYSYLFASCIMIFAGIFGYFFGVDAENKSLEQITNLDKDLEKNDIKEGN